MTADGPIKLDPGHKTSGGGRKSQGISLVRKERADGQGGTDGVSPRRALLLASATVAVVKSDGARAPLAGGSRSGAALSGERWPRKRFRDDEARHQKEEREKINGFNSFDIILHELPRCSPFKNNKERENYFPCVLSSFASKGRWEGMYG